MLPIHVSRLRHAFPAYVYLGSPALKSHVPLTSLRLCCSLALTGNRFNSSRGTQDLFARKADLASAQCHFVSAEGRREFIAEQFDSTPEILTFFREPISRTVSQWNHDKQYNQVWEGRTVTQDALDANSSRDQLLLRAVPKTLPEAYNDSQLMSALHERYGNWMLCVAPSTTKCKQRITCDVNNAPQRVPSVHKWQRMRHIQKRAAWAVRLVSSSVCPAAATSSPIIVSESTR